VQSCVDVQICRGAEVLVVRCWWLVVRCRGAEVQSAEKCCREMQRNAERGRGAGGAEVQVFLV